MKKVAWLVAGLLADACLLAGAAAAHPYSASRAEIDWNGQSSRFEVALEVLPEELVQMVAGELGEELSEGFRLAPGSGCDPAIAAYLERHFVLRSAGGETARLECLGKEISFAAAWLYFELSFEKPPAGLAGLELRVDLGLELSHEHLSAVRLRFGEQQQGLLFSRLQRAIRF